MKTIRFKLGVQITFVIILVFFIIGSIAAYFDIKSQTEQWLKREYSHAEIITDTILRSVENTMLSGKIKELDNTLINLSKTQHLSEVKILKTVQNQIQDKYGEFIYENKVPVYRFTTVIANRSKCYGCHSPNNKIIGFMEISIPWKSVIKEINNNTRRHIIITILFLAILSFVVIFFIEMVVNRPINKLLFAFNRIGRGDFNVKVNFKWNNEFDILATQFNQMAEKLKQSNEEIEKYHHEQITHADRLSSLGELLASLSHEIKNPLAGIKATLQVLENSTDNSMNKDILKKTNEQVTRLTSTIQNVLSYARMPNLKMVVSNIHEIMEKAFFLIQKQIVDQNINVKKDYDKNLPNVILDPEYILQVLVNMFLNAIQAMYNGGVLSVSTFLEGNNMVISISDTGKGVSRENLVKIFKPFFTTKSKGTGLGLPISQKIVKMHNGEINVKSEEGKGTEFIIKIPCKL